MSAHKKPSRMLCHSKSYAVVLWSLLLASCQTPASNSQPVEADDSTAQTIVVSPSPSPLPTHTLAPTATRKPLPSDTPEPTSNATETPLPSPTPGPPVYVLLPEGVQVFPGPDTSYPVLAWVSSPITFTVAGTSQQSDWLVVNLSPYTQGWVQSSVLKVLPEMAAMPVQGAPEGLATATPAVKPAIELLVYTGTGVKRFIEAVGAGFIDREQKYPALIFEVHTDKPRISFILAIKKENGLIFRRWRFTTDDEGFYKLTLPQEDLIAEDPDDQHQFTAEAMLDDGTTVQSPVVLPEKP